MTEPCPKLIKEMAHAVFERLVEDRNIALRDVIGQYLVCKNIDQDLIVEFTDAVGSKVWIEYDLK